MNHTNMPSYALETRGVIKTYQSDSGTIQAVDDVSLQVAAGEFVLSPDVEAVCGIKREAS